MVTDDNMVMPVSPMGGYGNAGFGGDWGSWIILFLIFGMFGNGWGGMNGGMGYDFPWLLQGQNGINANTNAGFQNAALQSAVGDLSNTVVSGFGDVQTALCGGFAGVNASINGAQNALAQQLYTNQIADLERSYAAQTANTAGLTNLSAQLANCCCENRAATQDVKYTIATEACSTRANSTANTQAILDKLCQIELDNAKSQIEAKNDQINQLRSELLYARGQASQDVQTAAIQAGQRNLANEVEQYVAPRPIPSYTVNSPYCCQTYGCGYGA